MYLGNAIGVVVPAYNEAGFVGTVIDTIPAFVDRTYVVDDHSTDGTWREISVHASRANNPSVQRTNDQRATDQDREPSQLTADGGEITGERVIAIRHPTNRGRGAAVKTGYKRALEDDMDVIVVMDGDGQMDPAILTSIIDPVVDGTADYAVGDRLGGPSYWRGMPPWRLFGNTLLSGLTRIASGYWHIRDPQNGYTAISASTLHELEFDRLYDQYGFLNDLLVNLNVAEKRVATVPMNARYGDEESGIRYSSFVPGLSFLLLKDFLWRLRVKYLYRGNVAPVLMYVLGVVSLLVGVARFSRAVVSRDRSSGSTTHVLGGAIALVGAMLLDKGMNEHLQQSGDIATTVDTGHGERDPEFTDEERTVSDDQHVERAP
ncbi:glycosyltransferase family 2 protein [Haloferax sp. DFSO52]|uniref:glycosyltransferase family 2 protein n=1 Tax=Haloferax sp. DFSO52 TaxID=3388505 RepID=UPI003A8B6791